MATRNKMCAVPYRTMLLLVVSGGGLSALDGVQGRSGMVSTAHPVATEAGVEILKRGGNAFDAAVAVAATLNVVEPENSGMGGYGLILIYDASKRQVWALNASGRIPRTVNPEVFRAPAQGYIENRKGAKSVVPPVNLRAWEELSRGYGALAWKDLFVSAIRAADDGIVLDRAIPQEAFDGFPSHAKEFYGKGAKPLQAGERLIQKDLARSLRAVAGGGARVLHGGPLGRSIEAEMIRAGGFLRLADLAESRAEWWEPLEIDYRGYRVVTASPPANSFTALVRLGIMSQFDVRGLGHNTVEYLHRFIEVTKHGEWCRVAYAGDPDVKAPPLSRLLSGAYWSEHAAKVGQETTHFAVADSKGNVVTATQTIGQAFGSRVMAPGTGIWLNNSLYYSTFEPQGNPMDVHPGRRKLNSNTPVLVMRNGLPWIAIGAAGGHTIPQTVPQAVMNMVDFGLDIQQALAASRVAFEAPDQLSVETGLGDAVLSELEKRGHRVKVMERGIGRLHGLSIEYGGGGPVRYLGGVDPRGRGLAKGL